MISCLGVREKAYKKNEIIFRAGSAVDEIGLVESGSVNIVVNFYWETAVSLDTLCKALCSRKNTRPYLAGNLLVMLPIWPNVYRTRKSAWFTCAFACLCIVYHLISSFYANVLLPVCKFSERFAPYPICRTEKQSV